MILFVLDDTRPYNGTRPSGKARGLQYTQLSSCYSSSAIVVNGLYTVRPSAVLLGGYCNRSRECSAFIMREGKVEYTHLIRTSLEGLGNSPGIAHQRPVPTDDDRACFFVNLTLRPFASIILRYPASSSITMRRPPGLSSNVNLRM